MLLYRIARKAYAADFSGTGSKLFGARWNSVGQPLVYFAESRSLAVLEVLVHIQPAATPDDFLLVTVNAPEDIAVVDVNLLPPHWNSISPHPQLKYFGDNFIKESNKLLLKAPSVIVPKEFNYLLNPAHKRAGELKLINTEPFDFDARLV